MLELIVTAISFTRGQANQGSKETEQNTHAAWGGLPDSLDALDQGGGSVTAFICCLKWLSLDAFAENICFRFS